MTEHDSSPEPGLLAAEVELYSVTSALMGQIVDSFGFPAQTAVSLHESYRDTFVRATKNDRTKVVFDLNPSIFEVRITTDTHQPHLRGEDPKPSSSDQYIIRLDTQTLGRFFDPEKAPVGVRRPLLSFRHLQLQDDGHSTEMGISVGREGVQVRHTAPLKTFDPAELEDRTPPRASLAMLDDVMQDRGLIVPDTVTVGQPGEAEVVPFVDMLVALTNNFHEVIPAGDYGNGSKSVAIV